MITLPHLPAEIFSNYEAKLTAGFSQTYTAGTNTGISVTAQPYQHGTVTRGHSSSYSCELPQVHADFKLQIHADHLLLMLFSSIQWLLTFSV